ncbi:MAG TPA: O-antigen ligase [Verrucomicrobiae bacterium]|nr:O-antigen ligase [Verrucomicrobiae bacterium]
MNDFFDRMVVFSWMALASGAGMVFYVGLNSTDTTSGGGTGIRAAYALFYLFFVTLLAMRYKTALSVLAREKWIFLLWVWAVSSTVWSPLPGQTLRRSVALLGTLIAGVFVATRFEPRKQLKILSYCIGLSAIASLIACLFFPEYAVAKTGEWTGVFYQKNVLGHTMALGVLCYAFLALGRKRGRFGSILMAILCGTMLLMSQSVTAMIVCTMMLIVLRFRRVLVLRARKLVPYATATLMVGIPMGIVVIQHMGDILKALGRNATLTGRIPLWNEVLEEISTRPITGFGYSAFWYTAEGDRIHEKLGWSPMHSHNGYFEITLALGLIGAGLLAFGLIRNIFRGVSIARESRSVEEFWPLFYLIFMAVDNVTESWMLVANSLFWMLYMANAYWLVRASRRRVTVEEDETEGSAERAGGTPMGLEPAES